MAVGQSGLDCGKHPCCCEEADHPGHGPYYSLTVKAEGKTVTRHLAPGAELAKVEREIAAFRRFQELVPELVEVNEEICEGRPLHAQEGDSIERASAEKKIAEVVQAEVGAGSRADNGAAFFRIARCGRLELRSSAEFAMRAAMQKVGSVLLEQLLNSDHGGHGGQRIACGGGHQAEFVDYRAKHLQTILGEVEVRRAYYHCAQCREGGGRGVIPKDQELDVVGTSFSPGMRRLMARVGAQEPFDAARQDLAELAGVVVPTKAVERVSEAVGAAAEAANQAERRVLLAGRGGSSLPKRHGSMWPWMAPGCQRCRERPRGARGKAADGKAKTREAKLGCVFTQTSFDAERWPDSRSRIDQLRGRHRNGRRLRPPDLR